MMNIFAWEGGLKADKKNGVIRAVAGIPNDKYLEKYLEDAGIPSGTRSQDLTNEQRIAVYRSNFGWESGAFAKVGGINSLEKMGDPRIAAAIADSFVRRGAPIIEPVLQLSINATLEAYPALSSSLIEARRPANGPDRPSHSAAKIAEDGIVGPDMMRALQVIATSEAATKLLLNQIADRRIKYDTDKYGALKEDDYDLRRYNYFRFQ